MPKSETLPLRRWPCWPGPYSRRLTGLLGRPKTFSPIRRSSLYLALVRFVTCRSPIRVAKVARDRTTKPCASCDHRFTGHAGSIASGAPRVATPQRQVFAGALLRLAMLQGITGDDDAVIGLVGILSAVPTFSAAAVERASRGWEQAGDRRHR